MNSKFSLLQETIKESILNHSRRKPFKYWFLKNKSREMLVSQSSEASVPRIIWYHKVFWMQESKHWENDSIWSTINENFVECLYSFSTYLWAQRKSEDGASDIKIKCSLFWEPFIV